MDTSSEWVDAVMRRLNSTLPHKVVGMGLWTPSSEKLRRQTIDCVIGLSKQEFSAVINGLATIIAELIRDYPPTNAAPVEMDSYVAVLDCLTSCLSKKEDTPLDGDDLQSLQSLFQKITQLCLLPGESSNRVKERAQRVLFFLSGLHFHGIFNKIILRVTSVNRVLTQSGDASSSEFCVIQLIPHLNLNAARLQQILQVMVTSFKDLKRHKHLFVTIPPILHRSIWNFIAEYPHQFNELLNKGYPSLPRSAEKLFNMCDEYGDNQRKKSQVWPLQSTLLILCPRILRDIAETGIDSASPLHKTQRAFLSAVMKAMSSISKQMCEAATVCGVDLFKACAYVGESNAPVFRYYLNLIQRSLQNLLFNPQQALFLHQSSSALAGIPTFTDLGMMVTCLVAQFRCNHRNSHIFSVCLNPSSPPVFRLAFVKSIHTVLKQTTLPSWPGPEAVYTYAPHLRDTFQNVLPLLRRYDTSSPSLANDVKAYLTSSSTATSMLTNRSKADRKNLVEMITSYQLMSCLIRLFEIDPMLAFSSPGEGKHGVSESLQLMTGLVSVIQHQSLPYIPLNVSNVLLTLHEPDNIDFWDPADPMTAFWEISNQVTYSIALKLFSRKTTNSIQLLTWLKQILHYRTQFLKKHTSEAMQGSSKISPQMYTMLETVLLLFLRNPNVEAVTIAMSCFKYLVLEAELVLNPMESSLVTYSPNLLAFQQLDQASNEPLIGRASQQKKIRSILRELVHTPGSALAWEDTYSSWRVTKSLLLSYQRDEVAPPDLLRFTTESFPRHFMRKVNTLAQSATLASGSASKETQLTDDNIAATLLNWTNMTGFLCSLAGVSTKPSSGYSFLLMSTGTPSMNTIDGDVSPSLIRHPPPPPPIKDPNHRVKRSSSYHGGRPKSVSTALHPVARTSTHEGGISPSVRYHSGEGILDDPGSSRTSQTEAFVSEIIYLLSCHNEAIGVNIRETVKELVSFELSPPVYPYLFQCIVAETSSIFSDGRLVIQERHTSLIDQLVSIVQHILETRTEDALEHLAHVKMDDVTMNFVTYVNSLDCSARFLTIRIKLSHLIDTLMQHSRDLSFRQELQFRNQLAEYLTGWVKGQVCIAANATHEENLQSDLDLAAMKALGQVLNGTVLQPKGMTGDIVEQKGKLFQKYFTQFMDLIHSLNRIDWSKLSPIHMHSLQRHVGQLKEATIRAMAYMLTANIDSGLTHAIGLGYHEDLRTRSSFIEVLTSILKEGAQFSSLAETALADRLNHMLELVTTETTEGDHPVVMALIDSVPPEHIDELAEVLVVLFDYKHKLASFLTTILSTELEAMESGRVDTLFRGNTIACKVLSCSFKTFGLYYLQAVVRPLILMLLKSVDKDYEVDPTRLSDTSKLAQNRANLLELVQTFFRTIVTSLSSVPLQLRTVCHILYSVVGERFPDASLDTVSSALFLRFINPAIVSPQSYNLVQGDISNGVKRGLTFISKVLQNLANHILFKKEAHMEVFNEFLQQNFESIREHALQLSGMGPYLDGDAIEYITFLKESYKHRVHSLLWNSHDKMAAYAASTRTNVSARHLFHELNTLLAHLGAPNYRRKRTSHTFNRRSALVSSQLEAFLDSMAGECDEKTLRSIKAKEIFYAGGLSKAGNPVFYFIARKFRGDQLHMSYQLLYYIMTLLKSCTEKAFELVIDLTQVTQLNEPDLELLVKFAAYVPELVMSQIEAVYLYNANLAFRQYACKLSAAIRIFSHIKGTKRVVAVDNVSQFSSWIDPNELKLPTSTMVFEEEGKTEFSPVHFLLPKQSVLLQIPATLQVYPHGLVVQMADRMKVFELMATITEIYHISDIREVYSEDKDSLTVRLVEGSQPLKFVVGNAEEVVKVIATVISRWQNQQPSRYMSERKLEPKDVPGTFLNLALLNLGSTDAGLRVAAYKLISGVKQAFHLRMSHNLESSHDLCVPMNSAPFVVSISTELAHTEPHLTLEFLSEVVAGFQKYTPALKQFCLAYMSPWLPNLSLSLFETTATEQEKLIRLIDMLVALTISEEAMYPLIQSCVWAKIGGERKLLKRVLDSFIRMGISDGLGTRKLEVLADTAVTLEQGNPGEVVNEVVKKILKTIAHTSDKVTQSLEQHFLWSELTVLSRFLLALSFNNKANVVNNLTDVFYLCVIMMAYGPPFVKATIYGIILNMMQSLVLLPEVMANEEAAKKVSLKLAEFSEPRFYHQFGLQSTASALAYQWSVQGSRGQGIELSKDTLSSTYVTTITQHLLEVVMATAHLLPDCAWLSRWQKLSRRTAFHYNPALQTRSFLMLGVISNRASMSLVTRTLRVMEETISRHEDEVSLLESIIICLTAFVPLLEEDSKLIHHLFWVSVGILQLSEATLYAAGLELMEACIKRLTSMGAFEDQTLSIVMQKSREEMEWPLSQMDREVGIAFSTDFNFSLAALLYKGFSHPLSTVRTRTQELLTTLFFIHSPDDSGGRIEVNQNNLAYITVLFPESEIVREHLREPRPRLKTLVASLSEACEAPTTYNTLLSSHAVPSQKLQILFLYVLACALIQSQDELKIQLLYEFLANASRVYSEVFPLIHFVLMQHLMQTLQQSQSSQVLSAVQQLVSVAVERMPSSADVKLSVIHDLGFGGLQEFFSPFPKHGLVYPTAQGPLLQKYLEALVQLLSPGEESVSKSHSLSSMKEFIAPQSAHSSMRRSSQAVPPTHHFHLRKEPSVDFSLADEDPEETEL